MNVVNSTVQQWLDEAPPILTRSGRAPAANCTWFRPGIRRLLGAADVPLVRRRRDQPRLQRARSSRRTRPGRPRGLIAHQRTRRPAGLHLRPAAAEVKRIAAALRGLGRRKGDRVAIYMPTSPEAIMLMLAHAHRRDPLGGLRRLRRGALGGPHCASGSRRCLHRRRHLPQGQGRAAEGDRRRDALADPESPVEHVVVLLARRRPPGAAIRPRHHLGRVPGRRRRARRATTRRWRRTSRRSSSPPPARPPSRSWPSTPTAATRSTSTAWALVLRH